MSDDEPELGERIELGPDDYLQESAQDWATLAVGAAGVGVGGAKVYVDYAKVKLDRQRLDFERQQLDAAQDAESHVPPGDDT